MTKTIKIGDKNIPYDRVAACVNACEDFTTEALNNNIVSDLLDEYMELADLPELEVLVKQTQGEIKNSIENKISWAWELIDEIDIEKVD